MNLSMPAIARVETGSLTPSLSRRERESRPPRVDMLKPHPCEPSRLVPANPLLHPPTPAGNVLSLPPGEGRGEGRSLHSSLPGSWSQYAIRESWGLPMNHPSPAPDGRSERLRLAEHPGFPKMPIPTRPILIAPPGLEILYMPHPWLTPWASVLAALRALEFGQPNLADGRTDHPWGGGCQLTDAPLAPPAPTRLATSAGVARLWRVRLR